MGDLEQKLEGAHWTFGGGTVLMLRIGHRQSKDIDLFVPDPQYLGYVSPNLSDVAEEISADYVKAAEFVKLLRAEGEIDIVAGPALTKPSFDLVNYKDRQIRIETCAEIIAKKMWHRGHHAKARDLYDLCAVADVEPEAIDVASPFFVEHGAAFLSSLEERSDIAREQYAAIESIGQARDFEADLAKARGIIEPLLR